ncbi:hypothetical protein B0H15DRAFT_981271 [Mycena belliarum]|uniref:Uncharacterized protein n=1 Tax=Mycena belliarum TaxID=1033014 RepID=A0AAD6U8Y2_9AGAR|nr:hypothetical protein B0H15DRAFT_981271 [Mycena belliae]
MPDSYLDQLWSRYHASPEPGMSSLYRTCLAFTKHVLQPSHIILSGGGFTLLPDLADPLPHVISGMNSVLRLAAQEHGLCGIPSIGTLELDVLTNTGLLLCSTQNQVVRSWVILIDRLAAAMHDIKYLCVGDPLHLSRHPWTSRIPSILLSLPPSLRIKLPVEFLRTHGIVVPCTANASTISMQTEAVMRRVASPPLHASAAPPSSVVSLKTLAERVGSIAGMTSSHIVGAQRINGRFTLDSHVFKSVEKTVHDLQSELTKTLSSSSSGFLVDPHGVLLQTLRGSSSIGELSVAWTALQRRLSLALNRLMDYQAKLQDSRQQTGSALVDMHTLAHNECRSACCTADGMNRGTLLDVRKAHHPSVKATVAAIKARERAVTKRVTCREPHGRASCGYVLPPYQSPAPANEIAHAAAVELGGQHGNQAESVSLTENKASVATRNLPKIPSSTTRAPALVKSDAVIKLGGREKPHQRTAIPDLGDIRTRDEESIASSEQYPPLHMSPSASSLPPSAAPALVFDKGMVELGGQGKAPQYMANPDSGEAHTLDEDSSARSERYPPLPTSRPASSPSTPRPLVPSQATPATAPPHNLAPFRDPIRGDRGPVVPPSPRSKPRLQEEAVKAGAVTPSQRSPAVAHVKDKTAVGLGGLRDVKDPVLRPKPEALDVALVAPPPKPPAPAPAIADTVELGGLRVEVTQPRMIASAGQIERGGLASVLPGRDTRQADEVACSRVAAESSVRQPPQETTFHDSVTRAGPAPLPICDTGPYQRDPALRGEKLRTRDEDSSTSIEPSPPPHTSRPESSSSPPAAPAFIFDEGRVECGGPSDAAHAVDQHRMVKLEMLELARSSDILSFALVSTILRTRWILHLVCKAHGELVPKLAWEREVPTPNSRIFALTWTPSDHGSRHARGALSRAVKSLPKLGHSSIPGWFQPNFSQLPAPDWRQLCIPKSNRGAFVGFPKSFEAPDARSKP